MPELPDLIYIEQKLNDVLAGKKIAEVRIREPIVIRILVAKGFAEVLDHAKFDEVYRHGPFLGFKFENGFEMVVHPMLAGKFRLSHDTANPGRGLCISFNLADGWSLHYLDAKKMGKVYLIKQGDYARIPRYAEQGVDILTEQFTLERFQELIRGQRKQVRVFLMDQTKLSAIGNAYADEILFDAHIHPKTFCYQLIPKDVERLYASIIKVIHWGITEVEKAQRPTEIKVREHMKVRNRKDEPCPHCGTIIRRAGVLGHDAYFCPSCQPAARKQFLEW